MVHAAPQVSSQHLQTGCLASRLSERLKSSRLCAERR